jgi:hypothetical protein
MFSCFFEGRRTCFNTGGKRRRPTGLRRGRCPPFLACASRPREACALRSALPVLSRVVPERLGRRDRLVAPHAVAKGGTVLVERPLVAQDDVGMSPTRSLLCAACGMAAGTPSQQVSCMQGQSRRGSVLRPRRTLPALLPSGAQGPAARAGAGSSASCGEAAACPRAGCDDVWCSLRCRARQRYEHLLTCCGRTPGGSSHGTYAADLRARLARCGGRACAGEGSSGECSIQCAGLPVQP